MGDGDENKECAVKQLWTKRKTNTNRGRTLSPKDLERKLETRKKLCSLRKIIKENSSGCDIKWSLFVSACNSYFYEESVNPFPPEYVRRHTGKDIEALLRVIGDTPSFSLILEQKGDRYICPLKRSSISNTKPNLIFRVQYSQNSEEEKRWKLIAKRTQAVHLCYGNKLEYFYTVLHKGMKLVVNESRSTDSGVYLSNDICDAIGKSPTGFGWGGSAFGARLCCVAVCELADHDQFMCCIKYPENKVTKVPSQIIKHYNVHRPDLARIRYLLIYRTNDNNEEDHDAQSKKGMLNWMKNHKFATLMVCYSILLVSTAITDLYFL
ncbi:mono [ADP-ribose] polymerase PARP16-like [Ctenocephalides felis]|uniref:mono [ADP-ribose] polymerase PARP16-like n=1 Tax=Ctenocephalides felis TaxID=7515 RepID=UPI000E6E32D5|nr:mono [ADP-ribose] polymerase PARP16-like [Ctenocephalides felis]